MKIAISCGDVNGIGLETFFKFTLFASQKPDIFRDIEFIIAINKQTMLEYFDLMSYSHILAENSIVLNDLPIQLVECSNYCNIKFGETNAEAGKLAVESLDKAFDMVYNKKADALVTLPISKNACKLAGWAYPDHTNYLADKCNTENPVMLFAFENLILMIATIHISLRKVSESITKENLYGLIHQFARSLRNDFNLSNPKIAVMGLNPHSGENGDIGSEENDTIIPVLDNLKYEGIDVYGPFPADGFFGNAMHKKFDGIVAMYHDQGLIPIKLLSGSEAVNVTAGLPIVRTSPDHGTGFDIAGKNIASAQSTINAIKLASEIFFNRNNICI
jgi:4-hydroxythreonine-4-phosphate dehydrogenase